MPPTNIPYTVSSLSHLFASMLNEPAPQKQGMSFVDARYVSQTVAAMPKNVIAAFCWDGMLAHYIVHCVCVCGGEGEPKYCMYSVIQEIVHFGLYYILLGNTIDCNSMCIQGLYQAKQPLWF